MRRTKYINEDIDWKKYTDSNPMLKAAKKVLDKIDKAGYKSYLVGGCVRDLILGTEPHDIDICGNVPLDVIKKLFNTYGLSGDEFGIIGIKLDGYTYEYALMRSDGKYSDGRKPETVSFDVELEDDMARRDFRFNAMAIDKDGNIIDVSSPAETGGENKS